MTLALVAGCGSPTDSGSGSGGADGIGGVDQGNDTLSTEDGPTDTGDGDSDTGDGDADTNTGDGDADPTDDDSGGSGTKFDLAGIPDGGTNGGCAAPIHNPCDNDNDPWHAIGVNCPNEYAITTAYTGHVDALYVHTGQLGTYNPATYPPLEGEKMVILSSGIAQQLTIPGQYASTSHVGNDPLNLPAPLTPTPVDNGLMVDCVANPNLIGTGDCSNTIQEQWSQGNGAYDYAEMRMTGEVPFGATGFSYNLAFFSTEYPGFYQSSFNDMYIAWLQSEKWTGNVSFDDDGAPISLNAGFLDYKDAPNPYDCNAPCTAPELQGTAMQGHAGTKWLTTSAGVEPGEDFTIVFAIFDLSDNILDSVVILDNFSWNCEGGPPITVPG
ncbi:Dipeptide-binding ABC transporter, periplasmic substrate-binding component [Enhygromyxa salina]|uniref:Dipeptide-binding ABC transporter, periplasmic substrate-binding component n=1 Tax=Enhygromyxa salina TaxID=215803 RepID=A0A0C2A5D0_9BACT|nr:choice-of-anchor L domain-containing protein [Enhygromyxa salina]KIG18648.1 Dipeptide-binding ABC transporter, periplasmic substrate-binding component [Enhygromyxa salina]